MIVSCLAFLILFGSSFLSAQEFEEIKILSPTPAEDDFFSVLTAVNDRFLFVSELQDDSWHGAVHVFEMDFYSGMWSFFQTLTASDIPTTAFGSGLAVDNRVLVVGAIGHNDGAGAAYVFEFIDDEWVEVQILTASDEHYGDFFGTDISILGDLIIVTAEEKRDEI